MTVIDPPVCIALDVGDFASALRIVDAVDGGVPVFKVGLQLFCAEGPRVVREIRARGPEVFLDLKINDIPHQSAGAVRAAAGIGVSLLTVHANAGRATVRAAVEAAADGPVKIFVVSVLTSLADEDVHELGIGRPLSEQVSAMARLASQEGAPGLVLGSGEVAAVRKEHPGLFLVTPGIRPATAAAGDQRRIGTPAAAVEAGADLLVLGRAVTDAPDPRRAFRAIVDEINEARGRAVTKAGA
jgi:orotidine-5'-phosphate decarboxylase